MNEELQEIEARKHFDFKRFLKKNLMDIILILAMVIYVTRGLIVINETGKTVAEILGDGAIALVFALAISQLLGIKGIIHGEASEVYTEARRLYVEAKQLAKPYADRLEQWCNTQNQLQLLNNQMEYLSSAGITIEQFRSKDFDPSTYSQECQEKIRKAQNIKLIDPLSVSRLMVVAERDMQKKHRTKKQFLRQSTISNAVTKSLMCLALGYYGVDLAANFDYRVMIWYAVQAIVFVVFGLYKYFISYMFITDDATSELEFKKTHLEQFIATSEKENNYVYQSSQSEQTKERNASVVCPEADASAEVPANVCEPK